MGSKYSGVLGKKRPQTLKPVEGDPPEIDKLAALEDHVCLIGLYLHYKVDSSEDLALALARDHVPGFQYQKTQGRRVKDSSLDFFLTVVTAKAIHEKQATSLDHACRILRQRQPAWKEQFSDREKMVELIRNYKKNNKGILDYIKDVQALDRCPEWHEIDFVKPS